MGADPLTDATAIGIGTSRQRPDATAKVRGEFEYAPDLHQDGMLWGATLRSPYPYARLLTIDLKRAQAMPGVHAVLGAWDVPDDRFGAINRDQPVLADDYVRYVGEPIAIVAADNPELARRAAAAIEVAYEPLVPTTDALDALAKGKIYRHEIYAWRPGRDGCGSSRGRILHRAGRIIPLWRRMRDWRGQTAKAASM